jgi:hypothetical protein
MGSIKSRPRRRSRRRPRTRPREFTAPNTRAPPNTSHATRNSGETTMAKATIHWLNERNFVGAEYEIVI